ncbi:hypothetical protein MYX82_11840, partial [Acidobacteria bacterium AH-259-D05]|nr:hypothetical protein [Acidobacteria bacterium AH-259-D05]
SNTKVRQEALIVLSEQTSESLRQIMEKDWPETLRKKALDGVMESHDKFFRKIMDELGETD